MPAYIETFSGKRFFPLDPRPEDICIEDIAHALARQCRFAGHVKGFYSVGEHSIHVALLLAYWGASVEVQLAGLLHDASETYLVDWPTPLKNSHIGAGYRDAEDRLMVTILSHFGLETDLPDLVLRADAILLVTEAREFMPYRHDNWKNLDDEPLDVFPARIGDIDAVESAFLRLFKNLDKQR